MPKVTSNLEHTKAFTPLPAAWYPAHPIYCAMDDKSKLPAIRVDWQIDDTAEQGKGRKIMFDSFLYAGNDEKTGEPYSLTRELSYLESMRIPFECGACGAEQSEPPKRVNTDYLCPSCEAPLRDVSFATEAFINQHCMIELSLEDVKKNVVDDSGNKRLVTDVDSEGLPVKRNKVKRVKSIEAYQAAQAKTSGNSAGANA